MFLPILVMGQDFIEVDTIEPTNKEFTELTNNKEIKLIESIDFTRDNRKVC